MAMATAGDVPLLIRSENASCERRVTPSWTVAQLKARLERVTGVPASCQKLSLQVASQPPLLIDAVHDEATQISAWPLQAYAELQAGRAMPCNARRVLTSHGQVIDTRPPGARTNYNDVSSVPKYEMSASDYQQRSDSVLAWKKANKLGRFDPHAPSIEQQKVDASYREVTARGIKPGARCRLLPESDHRRGTIQYVGAVPEIPSGVGAWVGIALDEPTGKNDGSVKGKRYFDCQPNFGVLVRPERVEVGPFPVLDEFAAAADDDDDEF